MTLYEKTLLIPKKIDIDGKPQEVAFKLVSCMCDNKYVMIFKKQEDLSYTVSAGSSSLSNFQMKGDYNNELRWLATEGRWKDVVKMINSGTSQVYDYKVLGSYQKELSFKEKAKDLNKQVRKSILNKISTNGNSIAGLKLFFEGEQLLKVNKKYGYLKFSVTNTKGTHPLNIPLEFLIEIDELLSIRNKKKC